MTLKQPRDWKQRGSTYICLLATALPWNFKRAACTLPQYRPCTRWFWRWPMRKQVCGHCATSRHSPYNRHIVLFFLFMVILWFPADACLTQWGRDKRADISQTTFLNAFSWINVWISINISLTFVLKGQINNIPALVQIMTWRRPGDKPLSESMMFSLLTHVCVTLPHWANCNRILPLWSNDAIWWHRSVSTLAQAVACCLTAPSHYLNLYWLITNGVLWSAPENKFTGSVQSINR